MADEFEGKWARLLTWLEEHHGFECKVEWRDVPGPSRPPRSTSVCPAEG